jgi:hypothetical protein
VPALPLLQYLVYYCLNFEQKPNHYEIDDSKREGEDFKYVSETKREMSIGILKVNRTN